jgi:hypothetical protein
MGSDISTTSSKENKVINKLGSNDAQSNSLQATSSSSSSLFSGSSLAADTLNSFKTVHTSNLSASSSTQSVSKSSKNIKSDLLKEITVVNQVQKSDTDIAKFEFNFNLLFKPLTPIGHETLSPRLPSLDSSLLTDLGYTLEDFLKSKSESVIKEQFKIFDFIREADSNCNHLLSILFVDRLKKISKIVENLEKLDEIEKLFEKCEVDLDNCLIKIDKLNNCLPDNLKLTSLNLKEVSLFNHFFLICLYQPNM